MPTTTVTFINCFTVPTGREDRFMELWNRVNSYVSAQPGYVDHRLHRARSDDARYRFVNVVRWESAQAFQASHDAGFQELVGEPGWAEFPATPALFDVVHTGGPVQSALTET